MGLYDKYDPFAGVEVDAAGIEQELKRFPAPAPEPIAQQPSSAFRRIAGDTAITALKGAIGLPEAAVGIADIATGGRVGKALEGVGYRPAEAKEILNDFYSPEQKQAFTNVAKADGFVPTLGALAENPSVAAHSVVESLPLMLGGGGVARGILKAAPKVAPWIAGAAGEGVVSAGSAAESIRGETADGLLTGKQAGLAALTGAGTAAIGAVAGKFANSPLGKKLGIADIDTMLASGERAAVNQGMAKQMLASGISEGVLEELPQSMQEQALQNLALDKPWHEGVGSAAAQGMVAGGLMGAAGGGFNALGNKNIAGPSVVTTEEQGQGPGGKGQEMQAPSGVPGSQNAGAIATPPAVAPVVSADVNQGQGARGMGQNLTTVARDSAPTPISDGPLGAALSAGGIGQQQPVTAAPSWQHHPVDDLLRNQLVQWSNQATVPEDQAAKQAIADNWDNVEALWQISGMDRNKAIVDHKIRKPQAIAGADVADLLKNHGQPSVIPDSQYSQFANNPFANAPRQNMIAGPGVTALLNDIKPVDTAAHAAASSPVNGLADPTEAQIEAGNYKKGHVKLHGLDISIENPAGSTRKGVDTDGKAWETKLEHHYGYIKGTVGRDKDHIDVFIKPGTDEAAAGDKVFIIDQKTPDSDSRRGAFDEHKVMVGFSSYSEASKAYQANYDSSGFSRISAVSGPSVATFKDWLKNGDTTKPFAGTPWATRHEYRAPVDAAPPAPASKRDAAKADTHRKFLKRMLSNAKTDKARATARQALAKFEAKSKTVADDYVTRFKAAMAQAKAEGHDINDNGVYQNSEVLTVPYTKGVKRKDSLRVAQGADGKWRAGHDLSRTTGDYEGSSSAPSVADQAFDNREEALKAAVEKARKKINNNGEEQEALNQFESYVKSILPDTKLQQGGDQTGGQSVAAESDAPRKKQPRSESVSARGLVRSDAFTATWLNAVLPALKSAGIMPYAVVEDVDGGKLGSWREVRIVMKRGSAIVGYVTRLFTDTGIKVSLIEAADDGKGGKVKMGAIPALYPAEGNLARQYGVDLKGTFVHDTTLNGFKKEHPASKWSGDHGEVAYNGTERFDESKAVDVSALESSRASLGNSADKAYMAFYDAKVTILPEEDNHVRGNQGTVSGVGQEASQPAQTVTGSNEEVSGVGTGSSGTVHGGSEAVAGVGGSPAAADLTPTLHPETKNRLKLAHEKFLAKQAAKRADTLAKQFAVKFGNALSLAKAKLEANKAKRAEHQARKSVAESSIYTAMVNSEEIGKIASLLSGKNDAAGFADQAEKIVARHIQSLIDSAETPQAMLAYSELLVDGEPVLPKKFFESLRKDAAKAFKQNQKDKNRDPEVYRVRLELAMLAKGMVKAGEEEKQRFKEGFDHALKGKTKSTLPTDDSRYFDGYEAGQAWIATEAGKAWYEGKPQKKEKSTGDALRRWFDRQKKDLASIDSSDLKKAWERLLKVTARAEHFQIQLADDATPGAKVWLEKFRSKLNTFPDFFTLQAADSVFGSGRYSYKPIDVLTGRYNSRNKGRFPAAEKARVDKAGIKLVDSLGNLPTDSDYSLTDAERIEIAKQIAAEYQEKLQELAGRFAGLRDMAGVQEVLKELYGDLTGVSASRYAIEREMKKSEEFKQNELFYYNVMSDLAGLMPEYGAHGEWEYLAKREADENTKTRKPDLTRPRLDKIVRTGLPDKRNGKDVSAAEFKKRFGFADVTIGEWVTAQQSKDHLNYSHDAFQTLATLLGISNVEQISFGGRLHFAIGALGQGKYAATFHPAQPHPSGGTVQAINVTNTRGDGAVLHEYFHAIDHMTLDARLRQVIDSFRLLLKRTPYTPDDVLKNVERFIVDGWGYKNLKGEYRGKNGAALYWLKGGFSRDSRSTQYYKNAQKLDGSKEKPYWSNDAELFARMAEAWGYDTLKAAGQRDDYLQSDWSEDGKVTDAKYRGTPYPVGEERARLVKLFGELINAMEWADKGPVLKEGHRWQTVLPYEEAVAPFETARLQAIKELDTLAEGMRQAAADKKAEAERKRQEAVWGAVKEEVQAVEPPSEVVVSEDPAVGTSVDELEALFDEAAAELREEAQEPATEPAGQKLFEHQAEVEKTETENKEKRKNLLSGRGGRIETDAEKADRATPTLSAEQDKTAAGLAKEMAQYGVKGIDEALKGLVSIFGGGQGKLMSFPAGLDEESYKKAKPHFEAAAKAFQQAGQSFADFIKTFFKAIIKTFGEGVKPYAVQFAKEYEAIYNQQAAEQPASTEPVEVSADNAPSSKLAWWVSGSLEAGVPIKWQGLFEKADKFFNGTQADGTYSVKDAYDALELGINRYLLEGGLLQDGAVTGNIIKARKAMGQLEALLDLVPAQTKRTAEQEEFQQFSTPPHFAFLANWTANLNGNDVYLEPSAGIGGLATFGKLAGAKEIIVNELSERRLGMLKTLPFDRFYNENAEQIDNILPDSIKPTVIVMNPPFTSTAGRVQGQRKSSNGAQHIEQALARLQPGGRLVAIVGEGMAHDKPAFRDWWKKIEQNYAVRANIGIEGTSYAKYGTTFDNQLLVIDKVAPDGKQIVTSKVAHPFEALDLLREVRDGRPTAETVAASSNLASRTGSGTVVQTGTSGPTAGDAPGTAGPAGVGSGGRSPAVQAGDGDSSGGAGRTPVSGGNGKTGQSGTATDQSERTGAGGTTGRTGATSSNKAADSTSGADLSPKLGTEVALQEIASSEQGAISNSVFEQYTPKKVRIEGAVPHNTPLVESAALASVNPPDPTYTPNLPKEIITEGRLSDAQLEAVVYAGQAHQQFLGNGQRRGFFLGDGTGVGKGRQISGIIIDNMRQGQKKAVWISKKGPLIKDAQRDFSDLGGDPKQIFAQGKIKAGDEIRAESGILFTGYPTLRGQTKEARDAVKKDGGKKKDESGISYVRTQQIANWLGKDFDGVIVFDEAHEMGNAVAMRGKRGMTKPSEQALAALELQKALPKARIVYVSATGATEVSNLAYAERLGLWGDGTPFSTVHSFVSAMSKSMSAMELVAQNLKQMGLYLARSLSFDGVAYNKVEHELTGYQRETYDLLAEGWQTVLQNINNALELTGVTNDGKAAGRNSGKIRGAIMSAFWGSHQRFFNQIITAGAMPSVLEQIERDLAENKSVVLQLVNTNEADQERALAKLAGKEVAEGEEDSIEELDLTPREQLINFIERAFPVEQKEQYADGVTDSGQPIIKVRTVVDASGKPVLNKQAVAERDKLIEHIRSIRIPDSAMQMLFNHFGPDQVAEITGRTQRVTYDENGKMKVEKRSPATVESDSDGFKNGKKRILIFSQAGGTGFSFHADKRYKNQEQRVHYILQPGWSADKAIQGLGRSHRTNQSSTPIYRLVTTDIPAQKRFISSIARRLEQLGALTSGQRDTAGGSLFSAADNLESVYSTRAVRQFFANAFGNTKRAGYDDLSSDLLKQMGLEGIVDETTGQIPEDAVPQVTQFLNRLLSLRLDTQSAVFDLFLAELEQQIEAAKQMGSFDDGLQTINHVGATVNQEEEVYRDLLTGAPTRYLGIEYQTPNPFYDFDETNRFLQGRKKAIKEAAWFQNNHSKRITAIYLTNGTRTTKSGAIVPVYGLWNTGGNSYRTLAEIGPIKDKWTLIEDVEEARKLWEAENAKRPKTSSNKLNLVVGGILPIWDRFNNEHIQVSRIATDDGRRFLGREIASRDLQETMQKLNVQSAEAKMTGAELASRIMAGDDVTMSNRWKLKRVTLSNDKRIEVIPHGWPNRSIEDLMSKAGVILEKVQYNQRYFVPTGAKAGQVIDGLMKSMNMNAVEVGDGAKETGAASGSAVYSVAHNSGSREVRGVSKDSVQAIGAVSAAKTRTEGSSEVAAALRIIEGSFPGAAVSEVSVSGKHATALRSIARLFGRELVFFAGEYADGSVTPAEGAIIDFDGKRVYVNAYSEKPHLQVLGHELLHALKQNDVDLYRELGRQLSPLVKRWSLYETTERQRMVDQGFDEAVLDRAYLAEEFFGDVIGDNFLNPDFWQAFRNENQSLFKRIAGLVQKLFNKVINSFRGMPETDLFISDVKAAQKIVAKTMFQYGQQVQAGAYQYQTIADWVQNSGYKPRFMTARPENAGASQNSSASPQDRQLANHLQKAGLADKASGMVRSLFGLVESVIPPKLKANLGKLLDNPWFGSEGNPLRRSIVNLNLERSHVRNELLHNLMVADPNAGYGGTELLDNILKEATPEERKAWNALLKQGDIVGVRYADKELQAMGYSDKVIAAYQAAHNFVAETNRVRFEKLKEISLLPYKNESWFDELKELLAYREQLDRGLEDDKQIKILTKLLSSMKKLGRADLESITNPTGKHVPGKVIDAYLKFIEQLNKTSEPGLVRMAYRHITEYSGEIDRIRNEWGEVKGYMPRDRKDGDWHVSVYRISEDEDGEPTRVKVYMKPTVTEFGAQKLVDKINADMGKYLKDNFYAGEEYVVEYGRNTATPGELLNDRGKELALESLVNNAFDKAGIFKTKDVDVAAMKRAVMEELSKEIMAQGFSRHGISREKHLIEGYRDEDYQAVLKEFASGMTGWLAKMQYAVEVTREADTFSQGNPDDKVWIHSYYKDSMKNSTYMDEVAATARSMGAVWYLGFKVSSAVINAFQNYTVGQAELARLMKLAGKKGEAVLLLARAQKDILTKKNMTAEEHQVLDQAIRQGTLHAQTIRSMSGLNEQGFGSKWKQFTEVAMTPFSWVEQHVNREPAMLAAYRVFKTTADGTFDQAAFKQAEDFVNNTHYVMGNENLPELVRMVGPIGKAAYLFQGYVHNYLLWLAKRGRAGEFEAIARSFGAIAVLGGVFALPGADDMDEWIEKWYGVSYKMKFKQFVRRNLHKYGTPGEMLTGFVNHGLPSVAGVDVSRALAVGIPFVGDADKSFGERIGGVWGGLAKKPGIALSAAGSGDYYRAIENLMPEFVANPMRAARQYNQGATTLGGKPVFDESGHQMKYGSADVVRKALGFNPVRVSERTELKSRERALHIFWKDKRDDVLAQVRKATTQADLHQAGAAAMKFNRDLNQSDAAGLIPIITAETLRKSRQYKPDKKKLSWERNQLAS